MKKKDAGAMARTVKYEVRAKKNTGKTSIIFVERFKDVFALRMGKLDGCFIEAFTGLLEDMLKGMGGNR